MFSLTFSKSKPLRCGLLTEFIKNTILLLSNKFNLLLGQDILALVKEMIAIQLNVPPQESQMISKPSIFSHIFCIIGYTNTVVAVYPKSKNVCNSADCLMKNSKNNKHKIW